METIFRIMLAAATLATATTGPRTCATNTPLRPRCPVYPGHMTTWAREGALVSDKHVCSSHAAHNTTTDMESRLGRSQAKEEERRAKGGSVGCGVPSFVATGPIGGRGAPSGRWALTQQHNANNHSAAARTQFHLQPTGWAVRFHPRPARRQECKAGAGGIGAGAPSRETAMLQRMCRLRAVEVWRGLNSGKKR